MPQRKGGSGIEIVLVVVALGAILFWIVRSISEAFSDKKEEGK